MNLTSLQTHIHTFQYYSMIHPLTPGDWNVIVVREGWIRLALYYDFLACDMVSFGRQEQTLMRYLLSPGSNFVQSAYWTVWRVLGKVYICLYIVTTEVNKQSHKAYNKNLSVFHVLLYIHATVKQLLVCDILKIYLNWKYKFVKIWKCIKM